MPSLGRITVPEISPLGTFPLVTDYPHELRRNFDTVSHWMANTLANLKIGQHFLIGTMVRVFTFRRHEMHLTEFDTLRTFWETRKGNYEPFTYNAPSDDNQSTAPVIVRFAGELKARAVGAATVAVEYELIETPSTGPTYSLNGTQTRFPTGSLPAALLAQAQELIPLVHVVVKEIGHPDNIYVSDRICTIGAQLYQARLLTWDSISQAIGGESDQARFTFGNADRVMRDLATDTNLDGATIEFSLFHVGTGIKIDIWKGYVVEFGGDSEDEFELMGQDGIPLNVLHPIRSVSRNCWKPFNDGINCIPPSSSGTPCDHGLDTEFGCRFHDNIRQFGGHITKPQTVRIKDNSTGTWGIGRLLLNSTSLVNDSIDGQPLPEIYTDVPIPVAGLIAAMRDESDFRDGLAYVGEGPISISENIFEHRLNGSPPHGTKDQALAGLIFGFRSSSGPEPEALQASGVFPADADHWAMLTETSGPPAAGTEVFAAGTALVEIRISDAPGLQLTRANENEAVVVVDGGLGGWYWDAPSTRLSTTTLTNPVWIAVNTLFRSRFLKNGTSAAQAALVDLDAAIASAAVCADIVAKLVGTGTETQFKFVGVLRDRRPLRDWLTDILTTCLGYYTWVFGKLYIGMRIHSGVVAGNAFSTGNVIDGTLRLRDKIPKFNHLTVEFDEPNPDESVDRALAFARTTVAVEDQDHVVTYGLKPSSITLNGVVSRSQALRVGATMLREELGGINEAEWRAARVLSFRSTVLALGVQAGDVCSLSHPDMPDGSLAGTPTADYGEFRIKRWRLYPDMSLEIEGETTTDSMYDLVIGPKPTDVPPDALPVERIDEILPLNPWFPDQESPGADDPLWSETDRMFSVQQLYDDQGNVRLSIIGDHPTTKTLPGVDPPRIGAIAVSGSGGSIPAFAYVVVCLSAVDGAGMETRVTKPLGVQVGSGGSNKIILSGITWPPDTTGYRLYAAIDHRQMCRQAEATSGQPSTLEVTDLDNIRTQGVPQENLDGLKPRAKKCWHAGVTGQPVAEVITGSGLRVTGAGWATDFWAGRYVMVLADESDGSVPPWVFQIDSNDADTLFCTPDPAAAGVEVGDPITILAQATTFSATTIGDEKFQNPQYPGGMVPNEERGRIVKIIRGTGVGQERLIASNTETVLTVTPAWDITPDATSIFIVLAGTWEYESAVARLALEQGELVEMSLPVDNLLQETLYAEVALVDRWNHEPERKYNPWRLIYLFGSLGQGVRDWWRTIIDDSGAPLEVGEDLSNQPPIACQDGLRVELVEWTAELTTAPGTEGISFDIFRSVDDGATRASIFGTGFLPFIAGGDKHAVGTDFEIPYLHRGERLSYDCVSADGTAAGLTVVLAGRQVPA